MLKQRVLTGIVLALLLLVVLFVLPYSAFTGFMVLAFTLAAWEWANLAGVKNPWWRTAYALVFAMFFVGLVVADIRASTVFLAVLCVAVLGWGVALLAVIHYPEKTVWYAPAFLLVTGLWLLVPAFACLLVLHPLVANNGLLLLVISSIAAADIGAYFAGRRFGRHKLAVAVSPNKTWEGFWGGIIGNVLLASLIAFYQSMPITTSFLFVVLMVLTAMASVLGDLFESMVKRERGIKDSSHLLPGHGGILDRLDGWTAALPLFTLLYLLSR